MQLKKGAQSTVWLAPLLALLTTFSVSLDLTKLSADHFFPFIESVIAQTRNWNNGEIIHWILFFSLTVFYAFLLQRFGAPISSGVLVGALFSGFLLLGKSYEQTDSLYPVFGSSLRFCLSVMIFCGYWAFFAVLLSALFKWTDNRFEMPSDKEAPLSKKAAQIVYFLYFGLIFAGWLPCLILCYPGSMPSDGLNQLGQFFGAIPATNNHPWFSTLLMGAIVSLGPSKEAGIFLYGLFQSLVCAAVYAAVCWQIRVQTGRRFGAVLTLLYFVLVPTWSSYAQMMIKDTLFCGILTAFFLCVVLFIQRRGQCGVSVWVGLFFFALLSSLLRNNVFYFAILTFFLLIIAAKSRRGRAALAAMGIALGGLYMAWDKIALPAMGVAPGSVAEMLSIPFQQTARYAIRYEDELTSEEIAVIDSVLDYNVIVTQYDPRVSDPVKNTYHGTPEALREYWGLWLRQGLRHPSAYAAATLNGAFGYFLPGYRYGSFGGNCFIMSPAAYGIEPEFSHPQAVSLLDKASRLWSHTPVLMLLNSAGAHCWLLILCTAALLRKRKFVDILITFPLWFALGTCCFSPVNGLVRYALPIMASAPLLMLGTWAALSKSSAKGNTSHGQNSSPDSLL